MNDVTAFWISSILTRPLGASFADRIGSPPFRGGPGTRREILQDGAVPVRS